MNSESVKLMVRCDQDREESKHIKSSSSESDNTDTFHKQGWIGVLKLQKVAVDFPSVKELKPLISQLWHGTTFEFIFLRHGRNYI